MTTNDVTPRTLDDLLALIATTREHAALADHPGPEPNRFHDARSFDHDPSTGTLIDNLSSDGTRSLRYSVAECTAIFSVLKSESTYRAGQRVALRDLAQFVPQFEAQTGRPLEKMNLGRVLHSWWWPMRARGWGSPQFDLTHQRIGLVLVTLEDPPVSDGSVCEPLAAFLAGMFAVAFGLLARRELAGKALSTLSDSQGQKAWKFLISTPKRIRVAEELILRRILPEDELLDRLSRGSSGLNQP